MATCTPCIVGPGDSRPCWHGSTWRGKTVRCDCADAGHLRCGKKPPAGEDPPGLSPAMKRALELVRRTGRLRRTPGGYWMPDDTPIRDGLCRPPDGEFVGTTTVRALLDRGLLEQAKTAAGDPIWSIAQEPGYVRPGEQKQGRLPDVDRREA